MTPLRSRATVGTMARERLTRKQISAWRFFYFPVIIGLVIGTSAASGTDQWWAPSPARRLALPSHVPARTIVTAFLTPRRLGYHVPSVTASPLTPANVITVFGSTGTNESF